MKSQQQVIDGNQNNVFNEIHNSSIAITQILGGFSNYQKLLEEKDKYNGYLAMTDLSAIKLRETFTSELRRIQSDIDQLSKEVINLATSFLNSTISSERFNEAKALFEEGKFQLANDKLNEEEINHDFNLYQDIKNAKEQELVAIRQKILDCAHEFIIKGELAELNAGTDAVKRLDAAEQYFLRAIEMCPVSEIKFSAARLYTRNLKFEEAEQICKQLKAEDNNLPPELNVKICKELGGLALKKSSAECVFYFTESIELCKHLIKGGDKKYIFWLADSYSDMGNYYFKDRNLEKAKELFQKAVSIRTETEFVDNDYNSLNQSKSLYNLAITFTSLKQYDSAIEEFRRALDCFNYIKDPNDFYLLHKKQIFKSLGNIYNWKYERKKAIECFLQQISVSTILLPQYPDLIEEIAETQWFIASKYAEMSMIDEAFEYFKYCTDNVRMMYKENLISISKYLDDYLLDIANTLITKSQKAWAKLFLDEANIIISNWDIPEGLDWLKDKADRLTMSVEE